MPRRRVVRAYLEPEIHELLCELGRRERLKPNDFLWHLLRNFVRSDRGYIDLLVKHFPCWSPTDDFRQLLEKFAALEPQALAAIQAGIAPPRPRQPRRPPVLE